MTASMPIPDEDAVRFAAASFNKGYALFRDPKYGGTALVPSEIEDVARVIVREYLWALGGGRGGPVMAMVNIDLARIPAAVRQAFDECESCEMIRKPRAWICDYHSGFWGGYEAALDSGRSEP